MELNLKAALQELVDCDTSVRAGTKATKDARRRRTELKKQLLDHMEAAGVDEINDASAGVRITRVVKERNGPLSKEQIVRAVSKLVGGAGGEDAGERVFAEADRARQAVAHASLNMKRVTQKEADAAAAQDAVEEEDE